MTNDPILISKSKLICRSRNFNYSGITDLRKWSWDTIDASRDRSCLPAVDVLDVLGEHDTSTTGIERRVTLCVASTSVTREMLCNRSAIGPVSGLSCAPRKPAVTETIIQEENPGVPPFSFLPARDLARPYALRSPHWCLRDVISRYAEEWERKSEWEEGAEGDRGEERGSCQDRNSISSSSWHLSTFLSLQPSPSRSACSQLHFFLALLNFAFLLSAKTYILWISLWIPAHLISFETSCVRACVFFFVVLIVSIKCIMQHFPDSKLIQNYPCLPLIQNTE